MKSEILSIASIVVIVSMLFIIKVGTAKADHAVLYNTLRKLDHVLN